MKTITIKIDDLILVETEIILLKNKNLLSSYINKALKSYNIIQKKQISGRCFINKNWISILTEKQIYY